MGLEVPQREITPCPWTFKQRIRSFSSPWFFLNFLVTVSYIFFISRIQKLIFFHCSTTISRWDWELFCSLNFCEQYTYFIFVTPCIIFITGNTMFIILLISYRTACKSPRAPSSRICNNFLWKNYQSHGAHTIIHPPVRLSLKRPEKIRGCRP